MRAVRLNRRGIAVATGVILLLTFGQAAAATAAGEIEVSHDGTSWGAQFDEPLFTGVSLVPRGSASAEFSVRNSGDNDGFLRVVLQDVAHSSQILADALSISLTTTGAGGVAVPLSAAASCQVLFEGELAAGETVPVVATLALADLSGTQGQGETATFGVGIQLSDTTLGVLPPTDCGSPDTVIEFAPFDNRVATLVLLGMEPNTAQLYEELLVLLLIAALGLGVGVQGGVARWQRRQFERNVDQLQYLEDLA